MSKKKSSAMTLKDFHGGSIPSDLPLPSAPGVAVRPSDRGGFDRPTSWGNPIGRSDHRLRPGSAGAARNLDVKAPFLSHTAQIGRNFDEDERKPLDGVSAPRRTVSDETIRAPPTRSELKPDYLSAGRSPSPQVLTLAAQLPGGTGTSSSFASKFSEATQVGVNSQSIGGISGQVVSGSYPNVWAARKEALGVTEPVYAPGSGLSAASKLAHASALDKVSSGRWQSRQPEYHQTDVLVVTPPETVGEFDSKVGNVYNLNAHNVMDVAGGREYHNAGLDRRVEPGLVVDDRRRIGGKDLAARERVRSPLYSDAKERNLPSRADGFHSALNEGKFGGLELQSQVHSEPSERPKLKLQPRSKPLENSEIPVDNKLGYQQPSDSGQVGNVGEIYANTTKLGLAGSETGNRTLERPKLNLKPRLQLGEQLEGNTERERKTLFGGARPRELVLKERGIDDDVVKNQDRGQPSVRIKQDVPRAETVPMHASPIRYNERAENSAVDQRIRKNTNRRDHQVEIEGTDRNDVQRRNRPNENWRNSRETEKPQQPQERPPSPETWRKPVEQPNTASSGDVSGVRYGKAASALELAQAFSRSSISDQKTADRLPAQRGLQGRVHMPFSRLTGPTPRPQINGY